MTKRKPSEVTSGEAKRRVSSGRLPVPEVPSAASQGEECKVQVYVAYPTAMRLLRERLQATPEEMAAWIDIGPEAGGIAAYVNANELDPPPRFSFPPANIDRTGPKPKLVASLMKTWFRTDDVANFEPPERYVTGRALVEIWSKIPDLRSPKAYIRSKIAEGQLEDLHPIYGRTAGTFTEEVGFPSLKSALFAVSQVRAVEASELAGAVGVKAPETSSQRATRLERRCIELRQQGVVAFRQIVAAAEGISPGRVTQLINDEKRRRAAEVSSADWMSPLAQVDSPVAQADSPVSKPKKPKRR